ncbi:MAG: phenylalanine--tRNA ligase subunit beta [Candidatus Omnitrophota bacterium]
MKFTYSWLKDFVEVKIPARELTDKLTMAGLEVTSLEERGGDFIFEIEITSNRPDWLSVAGIAREVAALTSKKLRKTTDHRPQTKNKSKEKLQIIIEDKKDCPLYTGKIIRNVKVGPSPDWLRQRLELIGCRSINNIVDITNYCLFTYGEPLHAFDLDKLFTSHKSQVTSQNLEIIIRRAKDKEEITTIDGQRRILDGDILVIADQAKAIAIAGIMGGKDSEVDESTKNILLEAAVFNPALIRRSRTSIGLTTDSSYRFERGIDAQTAQNTALIAAGMIQEIAGGECVLAKCAGSVNIKNKNIDLEAVYVSEILGANVPLAKIKKILENLGFKVRPGKSGVLRINVPFSRADVSAPIDLVEEISRIYGYENIPATLPASRQEVSINKVRGLVALIKNTLIGLGLNEVITYSLVDRELLKIFGLSGGNLEVQNPLSKEQEILRPGLAPSLARCAAYNLNQKQGFIDIFEVANIFIDSSQPHEELILGIALCGTKPLLLGAGLIKEDAGLLHMKGIIEALFKKIGVKEYVFKNSGQFIATRAGSQEVGKVVRLEKNILDKLDIKNKDCFIAEINLGKLFNIKVPEKKFCPLPKYPGIARDISFVAKEGVLIEDIIRAIKENSGSLLNSVEVVDYYKGKQIPQGFRALTISCLYQSLERTLTDEEINPLQQITCAILKDKFGANLR